MTKDRVKTLCEADPQLQWWAMVLFAEISECVEREKQGYTQAQLYVRIKEATEEFGSLVIQQAEHKAKEALAGVPSLEERVRVLEEKMKERDQ